VLVGIAFFDLDKTLLAANTARMWLRRELALGHVTRWQVVRATAWLAQYSLGFVALERAAKLAIGSLAGSQASAFRERTAAFYEAHVRTLYRPGARKVLEQHRAAGDRLVLLTASSIYLSELVERDLRLDAVLCNRLEVDDRGLHTGRTIGSVCFGSGKLEHARAFAERAQVQLSECAFYTDSYSDLPVLAAVGQPVAVNPDQRLRRTALRRGWPVVDWGTPAPS
jgi:HAD superfamily hydrolase (TIGR01490 family)